MQAIDVPLPDDFPEPADKPALPIEQSPAPAPAQHPAGQMPGTSAANVCILLHGDHSNMVQSVPSNGTALRLLLVCLLCVARAELDPLRLGH